ncbi:MAG: DHH family phosphoesterase [Streptococcaceae bacterium]|jgi:c-di-AMP phosphodiesterase-like protein|nr:DHH family phosphoesterase [Streptococcaceae bacterium]
MSKLQRFSTSTLVIFMLILTAFELFIVSFFDNHLVYILFILVINVLLLAIGIYQSTSFRINRDDLIHNINQNADESLNTALQGMPIGVIKFDAATNSPEWYNPYVELIFKSAESTISREIIDSIVTNAKKEAAIPFDLGDKKYDVTLDTDKNLLYLVDATVEISAKTALSNRRPIIGVVAVDNYDDVTDSLTEAEISMVNSFVVTFLDQFAASKQIYLRRINSDRFVFYTNYRVLSSLMAENFSFLDDFRKEASEQKRALSLSIGISYGINDFAAIGRTAFNNLELAQVRGGDQVVIKENTDQARALYFGGNSDSRATKSRTRARAIATALRTIVQESDQVFVAGHRFTDMDALGAAVAMKNFAQTLGKEAFVVYNPEELLQDVSRAVHELNNQGDDLFEHIVRLKTAKQKKESNALLILVDHSKLSQTLDLDFYKSFEKVVVIDHHRRDDDDFPENVLLSYIESGASSASEMAVEVLQFQDNAKQKMTPMEASVVLAGIAMDTNFFKKGTTSKTFEAAGFLREQGADNDVIQSLLATEFDDYKKVNEIAIRAEIMGHTAIATAESGKAYDKITLAKAADALLSIKDVETSFTLAESSTHTILISARSRGEVNVQRIMEAMGGGGHFDAAASELEHTTLMAAEIQLRGTIADKEKTA